MKTHLHKTIGNAGLLFTALMASTVMWGQVTLPGTSPYSENFNTTPGATGTTYPTGWTSYNGTAVDNAMTVGNATSNGGANYNYGSKIGILGSGSAFVPGSIVLRLTNTTGKSNLKISYDVIKIREQARSNSFDLEISTTSATSGFTAVSGGAYASGTLAEGTVTNYTNIDLSAIDNNSGNVWIRWKYDEISGSGSRDGIALDNVVVSWADAPTVTTVAASAITASSATLNGTLNANGTTSSASFNWGTSSAYGNSIAATPSSVSGTTAIGISAVLNTLLPNTQYFFRAVGTAGSAVSNGTGANFYTAANVPGILTVNNPGIYTLDITVNATTQNNNPAVTTYAIREINGSYVQANGTLGVNPVWRTAAQWGTITVTGLADNTAYTFGVKARNQATPAVETIFSADVTASTLVNTLPTLTVGTIRTFGEVCVNQFSEVRNFIVEGINMTTAPLVVGPLAGYEFSETATGPFSATLSIAQAGGTLNQTVYIRFAPTTTGAHNGNIAIVGGDAPAVAIAASGTGINTQSSITTIEAGALSAATAKVTSEVSAEGCSTVTERGIVYSTSANPVIGGTNVIKVTDAGTGIGNYVTSLSGLIGGTVYYTKGYSVNNGGTTYGQELTFTTAPVIAPVATDATNVTHNSFTANWDASEGAASYRLDVSESATFGTSSPATELFFSEYVEGTSTNKYVEIYNGTGAAVNLSDYRVRLYSNGSTSASGSANDVQLSGTLANGSTIVLRNSGASIYSGAATVVASVNFNGNDAVALYKVSTNANVDIIGRIGQDPGAAWTSGSLSTLDQTLVRKAFVTSGVTVNPTSGFPTLATEWDALPLNDVSNLGTHTFAGIAPSFVAGYENLTVNATQQNVTGLTPEKHYYYRVRAVAGNTSDNSNIIEVVTIVNTQPTFTVTALTNFGEVCINAVSTVQNFTLSGINLTTDAIEVGPAAGFTFATDAAGPFTSTLSLTQAGGTYSQVIYVRFEPTTVAAYNENVTIAGAGTEIIVAAAGTGVNKVATVATTATEVLSAYAAKVSAEVTNEGCSTVIERGIVFSTLPSPEIGGTDVVARADDGTGIGAYTVNISDLYGQTVYYTRAYSVNAAGVSYGQELTFTTAPVPAPIATEATAVTGTSFTANWDEVFGAESYRIDVSESATFGSTALATDLFFSEYVEGTSTNKYLEIYNGTGAAVNLSDYRVRLYSNGSTSASGSANDVQLSGTLASGSTVVIRNSGASIYSGTATVVASVNFNGNDAVALYKISTNANVDIIGRIGEDPGVAWTSGSLTTLDKTLVRKASVISGVSVNPTSGFPTLATEWDVLPVNDVTNLGTHTFSGSIPSFLPGYENVTSFGVSLPVSGLVPNKTYYYRVRAVAGNTSGNSNIIDVTTVETVAKAAQNLTFGQPVNAITMYKQNNVINVVSSTDAIQSVTIFDLSGKVLFNNDNFNAQAIAIDKLNNNNQVIIVRTVTVNNEVKTQKMLF
ncbi:lamin tail domain-containing protein [Flavobacterium sp. CAU 1735]|uniref:beta strand repeat-containing protein n=1 Tax=Flavobacterium sp. CAU 1735 TaxID=3140361 RepID=UPI003261BC43